jgi:hypothetical protein
MMRGSRSTRAENTVDIPSDFFIREMRGIFHSIKELVEFRGYEDITLDFSRVYSCFPDAILPIISCILKYRAEGVGFHVIPPTLHSLARTFESSNWLHLIEPTKFSPGIDHRMDRFPARVFRDSSDQHLTDAGLVRLWLIALSQVDQYLASAPR